MPDHGENYTRLLEADENGDLTVEVGLLGVECGHHCGVQMTGTHQRVGHCPCVECHDGDV